MPQEVIMTLAMDRSEDFLPNARRYLLGSLNLMELSEFTQVFYSVLNKHLQREKTLMKVRTTDPEKAAFDAFLSEVSPHFE